MIHQLNEGFRPPGRYLGANVEKVHLKDGIVLWSNKCVYYLKSTIENVDNSLGLDKTVIKNYGYGHREYSSIFRMELDVNE